MLVLLVLVVLLVVLLVYNKYLRYVLEGTIYRSKALHYSFIGTSAYLFRKYNNVRMIEYLIITKVLLLDIIIRSKGGNNMNMHERNERYDKISVPYYLYVRSPIVLY